MSVWLTINTADLLLGLLNFYQINIEFLCLQDVKCLHLENQIIPTCTNSFGSQKVTQMTAATLAVLKTDV